MPEKSTIMAEVFWWFGQISCCVTTHPFKSLNGALWLVWRIGMLVWRSLLAFSGVQRPWIVFDGCQHAAREWNWTRDHWKRVCHFWKVNKFTLFIANHISKTENYKACRESLCLSAATNSLLPPRYIFVKKLYIGKKGS